MKRGWRPTVKVKLFEVAPASGSGCRVQTAIEPAPYDRVVVRQVAHGAVGIVGVGEVEGQTAGDDTVLRGQSWYS
jgi:hypothetical protein